ncbi:hypothetical protein M9458_012532, partial [Cirrhinus mrigala]
FRFGIPSAPKDTVRPSSFPITIQINTLIPSTTFPFPCGIITPVTPLDLYPNWATMVTLPLFIHGLSVAFPADRWVLAVRTTWLRMPILDVRTGQAGTGVGLGGIIMQPPEGRATAAPEDLCGMLQVLGCIMWCRPQTIQLIITCHVEEAHTVGKTMAAAREGATIRSGAVILQTDRLAIPARDRATARPATLLQGVYGSWSTFRSSLSSDYDPFVYCGPGKAPRRGSMEATQRPRSLDSVVNRTAGGSGGDAGGICPEEQQQQVAVFSHVHYHRHRHHYYEDGELSQGPGRGSDEDQGATSSAAAAAGPCHVTKDKDSTGCQVQHQSCHCPKTDLSSRRVEDKDPDPVSSSGASVILPSPPLTSPSPPCCHKGPGWTTSRKAAGCPLEAPSPVVHFHQNLDLQDDCSIHIHYGQGAGSYCCTPPPDMAPTLLPVPLILDSTGMTDWPCCSGAHVVWQKQVQQAHSEPQLLGPTSGMDRPLCRAHHGPGDELPMDICL